MNLFKLIQFYLCFLFLKKYITWLKNKQLYCGTKNYWVTLHRPKQVTCWSLKNSSWDGHTHTHTFSRTRFNTGYPVSCSLVKVWLNIGAGYIQGGKCLVIARQQDNTTQTSPQTSAMRIVNIVCMASMHTLKFWLLLLAKMLLFFVLSVISGSRSVSVISSKSGEEWN